MRLLKFFTVFIFGIVLIGCAPSLREKFKQECNKVKNTDEQCRARFRRGTRLFFGKKKPGDKEEYAVNYALLKTSEVRDEVDGLRQDLHTVLDYNNKDSRKYIDIHKLGPDLEHTEKIFEAISSRLLANELNTQFQTLMGTGSEYSYFAPGAEDFKDRYDIKNIFLHKDPVTSYPFQSDQIEEAKRQGKLQKIEDIEFKVERKFDRKVQDPNDPTDPNLFIWRSKKEWLRAKNYKILDSSRPDNNIGNYVEISRVVNDKEESHPALKIFFPHNNEQGILVLDTDREGEPGFGLPNLVVPVSVSNLKFDIIYNEALMGRLFEEKEEQQRIKPQPKPIYVDIAKIGQPQVDVWQSNPAGWTVPFKYENGLKNNYNVKLKMARSAHGEDPTQPPEPVTQIEYIAREWTGANQFMPSQGAVVEYFKPKPPYDQKNIAKAEVRYLENTKKVVFDFQDGSEDTKIVAPGSNLITEDEPYAIEYTEGSKRWHIEKDKGSAVFNKKKEIAVPDPNKPTTGVYTVSLK